jgi:hypothetical protein
VLTLLTSDAWLTMPPEPYEYQGHAATAAFLHHRATLRSSPLRVVPTLANTQPAFDCYLPSPQAPPISHQLTGGVDDVPDADLTPDSRWRRSRTVNAGRKLTPLRRLNSDPLAPD